MRADRVLKPNSIKTYKDLIVWQEAMALAEKVHDVTSKYPNHELYGLTAHTRKSAISGPSNIAEGFARHSNLDFIRFLRISQGSINELLTQLELGFRFKYLSEPDLRQLESDGERLLKKLSSLIGKLNVSNTANREKISCEEV